MKAMPYIVNNFMALGITEFKIFKLLISKGTRKALPNVFKMSFLNKAV